MDRWHLNIILSYFGGHDKDIAATEASSFESKECQSAW